MLSCINTQAKYVTLLPSLRLTTCAPSIIFSNCRSQLLSYLPFEDGIELVWQTLDEFNILEFVILWSSKRKETCLIYKSIEHYWAPNKKKPKIVFFQSIWKWESREHFKQLDKFWLRTFKTIHLSILYSFAIIESLLLATSIKICGSKKK